jgi:hypothetical protein
MAEETQTQLPEGYSVIDNATVKEVRENQYGGYDLIAETISPLIGTPVEQRVPLYQTDFNTRKVSQDVIENTQSNLRKILGDDTITFHESPVDDDPTDIVNWAKAHAGQPIKALYAHDGKVRIAAPRANSGQQTQRRAFWLKKYKPTMGQYNPDEHFLTFFDAQTDADQEAIDKVDLSSDKVRERTSGSGDNKRTETVFSNVGTIQNMMYTSTAEFANGKPVPTKDLTANEVIDYIVALLRQDAPEMLVPKDVQEADKALADKLEDLKKSDQNGLYAIYTVLGSVRYMNNVSSQRRDSVRQFLQTVSINIVSMYIRTDANKVFMLSWRPTRRLDTSRSVVTGFHIEFLKNDFKSNDILLPLVDGAIINESEALQIAKDQNLYNEAEGVVQLHDMREGMDFLRAIFNDKKVRYNATIADANGKTERRLLGTTFVGIESGSSQEATDNQTDAVDTEVLSDNPFDTAVSQETEAEPTTQNDDDTIGSNPFGV